LRGDVEVYLASPEFQGVFRFAEGHTLFQNGSVRKITYFLEDAPRQLVNLPPDLFGNGIIRHALGKELVFRVPPSARAHLRAA
jgi:hypothetical protein